MSIYKPGKPNKYNPSTGCGSKPSSSLGEYRIRYSSGTLCYIGETCNLNRRINERIRSGKLSEGGTVEYKIADGRSSSATRRKYERMKISQHNPIQNCSSGGEGRIATKRR